MNKYRLFETDEFQKKLNKLPAHQQSYIKSKLVNYIYPQLKNEPYYGKNIKKLVDYHPKTWRYRIGNYRLFYVINEEEKIIYFLSVDLRKDAY